MSLKKKHQLYYMYNSVSVTFLMKLLMKVLWLLVVVLAVESRVGVLAVECWVDVLAAKSWVVVIVLGRCTCSEILGMQ